jgi:Holliday junction resolvase-like predicted endonuclease
VCVFKIKGPPYGSQLKLVLILQLLEEMKKAAKHIVKGQWAESVATRYLTGSGWRILKRNYRTPIGEIDIVAEDQSGLCHFIEVKSLGACGLMEARYSKNQRNRLEKMVLHFQELWQIDIATLLVFVHPNEQVSVYDPFL